MFLELLPFDNFNMKCRLVWNDSVKVVYCIDHFYRSTVEEYHSLNV